MYVHCVNMLFEPSQDTTEKGKRQTLAPGPADSPKKTGARTECFQDEQLDLSRRLVEEEVKKAQQEAPRGS